MTDTWNGEPWVSSNYRPPKQLVRFTPLDAEGQPAGPTLEVMAGVLSTAFRAGFEATAEAFQRFSQSLFRGFNLTVEIAAGTMRALFVSLDPWYAAQRYAVERLGVTEVDIREVHLAPSQLDTAFVKLWNHRRIPLGVGWWEDLP